MSAVIDTPAAAEAAPAREPEMRMVDLVLIEESLTNPRKTFNQEKLQELADTIKAQGVLQPVLLRPLPGSRLAETFGFRRQGSPLPTHELVCGARRFRAARLAGLKTIPAMIRELNDHDARQMQHIENIQRQDVDKLEEAESFRSLMDEFGMGADAIGEQIKQSRSYVYAALKILDLCQAGRQLLREGKMDFSKGLLIARIPSEAQQLKAIKDLTTKNYEGDDRYGARAAAEHVRQNYMLALDKARFSRTDADLLPEAGACTDCPKRTGANPELFADVKSADVCTDAPCYRKKEEAHGKQLAAEASAKGQTVIVGKEAEELVASGYSVVPKLKGYRRLDFADDSPTDQPLRKIIGKQMKAEGIEPIMIENPRKKGELLACLTNEVAGRLLKTVESQAKAEGAKAVSKEVQKFADEKKAKAEARAQAQYEQAWRDSLVTHTWVALASGGVKGFGIDMHRYLARAAAASLSTEDAERVAVLLGLGSVGAHSAVCDYANTTDEPDVLHLLIIAQRTSRANDYGYGGRPANEGLLLVAKAAHGEQLPSIIHSVREGARDKYLSAPVKSAAPESASTPKPAAQASSTRAKGKGKIGPAAQAPATAKTTAQEASAQIAAALADAEAQNQAPAAQSNEGPAVADAQRGTAPGASDGGASEAIDQAPAAHGDEAPPAAPAPAAAPVLEVGCYAMVSKKHLNKRFRGHLVKLSQRIRSADGWSWIVHRVDGKEGPFGPSESDLAPAPAPVATDSAGAQAPDQAPTAQGDEAPPAAPAPATPSPSIKASARAKKGATSTEASTTTHAVAEAPAPAAAPVAIAEGVRVRVSADVYLSEKQAYASKEGKVVGSLKGFKGTWRVEFDQADIGDAKPTSTFKEKELEVVP